MFGLSLAIPDLAVRQRSALSTWLLGATFADWNPRQIGRLFQNSNGTTPVAANDDPVGLLDEPHGFDASQATSGARPSYQAGYLRGDGSADNLLSSWLCGAGANTLIAKAVVPASISATAAIVGAQGAGDTRFYMGFNTNGTLHARVGDTTNRDGSTDLRDKTVVIALTTDATTVKTFAYVDGEATQHYTGDQGASVPTTTVPARLCALNANGSAGGYFAGDLGRVIAAQKAMTLTEFTAIAPLL